MEPGITVQIRKNLQDKLYERRKAGALEVEQLVKQYERTESLDQIVLVINTLKEDFISATSTHARKGGLIALAAAALGLGKLVSDYVDILVPPVLTCFRDPDHKVRYYACESLFNIAKVSKENILIFINEIFDGLSVLASDPDKTVKDGCELLDRLMKDIITGGYKFDVAKFVPLISERICNFYPDGRKFLVGWVTTLDSVPDIDFVQYLPHFLSGLLRMLSSQEEDIRRSVDKVLHEFLREIIGAAEKWKEIELMTPEEAQNPDVILPPRIDYGAITEILLPECTSSDLFTSITSLTWIKEFILIGKSQLIPFGSRILSAILKTISAKTKSATSAQVNDCLKYLVEDSEVFFTVESYLEVITEDGFSSNNVHSKMCALDWILVLLGKLPEDLQNYLEQLYPELLNMLTDSEEKVLKLDLKVLARLSTNEDYFIKLMSELILLLRSQKGLIEERGILIIKQLSYHIPPVSIYRTLAQLLETETETEFAFAIVQILNLFLLTSPELVEMRNSLKELKTQESRDLFVVLYRSWCHNACAAFSLCLLCQVYDHASNLIFKFTDLEVTLNFLIQMEKLVQLLESPIFMYLRLQLLEPEKYSHLYKCLYGLLMLLPQSKGYETLDRRLRSVAPPEILKLIPPSDTLPPNVQNIDFGELLNHFVEVQESHSQNTRDEQRNRN